jgi:glutamine synthetase
MHQSLQKAGQALFAGDKYGGLSDTALYIGGIIKHGHQRVYQPRHQQLQATGSRIRGACDATPLRPATVRHPSAFRGGKPQGASHEVRFPDSTANPSRLAAMMGRHDGIQNRSIREPARDLYDLEPEEEKHIPASVFRPRR